MKKKLISILLILILIINIVLFAMGLINEFIFWTIIAIGAASSYFLNKEKNKNKKKLQ